MTLTLTLTLTLSRLHNRTKLVVDFMTLRAFSFTALWFDGPMVLWSYSRARPGASLGHDFMNFSGFLRLFCPPTLPLGEFRPETLWVCISSLGLSVIEIWVRSRLC